MKTCTPFLIIMMSAFGITGAQPDHQGPEFFLTANEQGAQIGVIQEFSTWSDLTAMFRPSRWKDPFAVGGSLSWLNYRAWQEDVDRTGKVLIGELIVAGAVYAVFHDSSGHGELVSGDKPNNDDAPSYGSGGGSSGDGDKGGGDMGGGSSDPGAETPF